MPEDALMAALGITGTDQAQVITVATKLRDLDAWTKDNTITLKADLKESRDKAAAAVKAGDFATAAKHMADVEKGVDKPQTILAKLRDLGATTAENEITLGGTFGTRKDDIVTAVQRDDYTAGEGALAALEKDVAKAVAAKKLYDAAYAGLPGLYQSLPAENATPPSLLAARKEVADAEEKRAHLVAPAVEDWAGAQAAAVTLRTTIEAFNKPYETFTTDKQEYEANYNKDLAARVAALKKAKAPPPILRLCDPVVKADGVRADHVSAQDYAQAKVVVRGLKQLLDNYDNAYKTFNADKKEYETNSKGLALRYFRNAIKASKTFSVATRLEAASADHNKLNDLISDAKQDYAQAKTVALEFRKKLDEFDKAFEAETKAGGQIAGLGEGPDREKAIDKLVMELPENAGPEMFELAIKERFGVTLQVLDSQGGTEVDKKSAVKLKRLYELLTQVPEAHARNNPSLRNVLITGEAMEEGGVYSPTKKAILLNRSEKAEPVTLGKKEELGFEPDADCAPKDTTAVPLFDFATLHEVGHAVDDSKGFMTVNGKQDAFGGWKSATVAEIVAAAATKFGDVWKEYIKKLLEGGDPPSPTTPDDPHKKEVDLWYTRVSGKKLWWSGDWTKACAIGDTVYQLAYDGQWVSYKLAARKQGISGYQFRAPAEWFAELYAAYYSGKLKDSHPIVPVLKELEKSKPPGGK